MLQQFKNMNELTAYLGNLEERILALEAENRTLQIERRKAGLDGGTVEWIISSKMPQTSLVNPNFLKRAFAVWGHFFVANLIVGIVFGAAYLCLMLLLFGSVFGNLIQSGQ